MVHLGAISRALPLATLAFHAQGSFLFHSPHRQPSANKETCTELVNQGSYFSVDIEVGTPGQKFSVVADTGSNSVIVPSCLCKESGFCSSDVRCFVGTNHSSSFSLKKGPSGPEGLIIAFGSGLVQGVVANDVVKVGQLTHDMPKGVVLMTAQKLNVPGTFEGILGLGVPQKDEPKAPADGAAPDDQMSGMPPGMPFPLSGGEGGGEVPPEIQEVIKKLMDSVNNQAGQAAGQATGQAGGIATVSSGRQSGHSKQIPGMEENQRPPPGFLEQAAIDRFSICFNEGANGVLRLGPPAAPLMHGSVGSEHWGVDFRGMSIGNSTVPVHACLPSEMQKGQETPCGGIPDSGTTLIMAPEEHLNILYSDICDQWDRCRRNHSAIVRAADAASKAAAAEYGINPFDLKPPAKAKVFQLLLLDCNVWGNEANGIGLDELPPIHFKIAGTNGTLQNLTLPSKAYIMESELEEHTNGSALNVTLDDRETVCMPAFGPMSMATKKNGPVWIFGTPFFYEFNVGYDLSSSPPSISFSPTKEKPCGACGKEVNFMTAAASAKQAHRPRRLKHRPRQSSVDVTRPL